MSSNHGSELQPVPLDGARLASAAQGIAPEGLLTAAPLTTVNLPPGFCFPSQPALPCVQTSGGQPNGPMPPSPLNMTLGFPMNMAGGPMPQQFVQPFSMGQICTTVGQALSMPISQAILAVPSQGGQFLSTPFSPFQPLLMGGSPTQVFNTMAGLQTVTSLGGPSCMSSLPLTSVQSAVNTTVPLLAGPIETLTPVNASNEDNKNSAPMKSDKTESEPTLGSSQSLGGGEVPTDEAPSSSGQPEIEAMETEEASKRDNSTSPSKKAKGLGEMGSAVCVKQEAVPAESGDQAEGRSSLEKREEEDDEDVFIKDEPAGLQAKQELEEDILSGGSFDANDGAVEYEEEEFNWEDYQQETGSQAAPHSAFKHVECSLQSGIEKGMKLEVPNKSCAGTFWVASVVLTCGPILQLRYEGYEDDGSQDFWIELNASEIHPIGWCSANEKVLQPPDAIKDKFTDWRETLKKILTGAKTAPNYLLDKNMGAAPADQLKEGMRLELQQLDYPIHTWIVRIMENVGGRLTLCYEGREEEGESFYLFYLDNHLHPVGWTKDQSYTYSAPPVVRKGKSEEELKQILDKALKLAEEQLLPTCIFKDQMQIARHQFEVGHKMELLHCEGRNVVLPATVVARLNAYYFLVEADTLDPTQPPPPRVCCHARSHTIYPIQWGQYKGFKLTPPPGWQRPEFSWPEYLASTGARAAPEAFFDLETPEHEFERGMKLEAVNPLNPREICAATITKITHRLMWIHLDTSDSTVASHVEHIHSHNLFPVGWCESNDYQLSAPRKTRIKCKQPPPKQVAVVQPEVADGWSNDGHSTTMSYTQVKNSESSGNTWCPLIYFNHRCFSGPYLSKGRIAELPKSVGPGPILLVMKEVLSMLINVAYKSCRVLRELQMEGAPNPAMQQQILKAKYKNKSYRATVEICRHSSQLEEFCRQVCIKLECCPNLVSPHFINSNCPENCSQLTKTKYTYYYGKKKKKIGRPPGGHTNLENGPKKPGKRKKRKKINLQHKKSSVSRPPSDLRAGMGMEGGAVGGDGGGDDDKASVTSTRTVDSVSTVGSQEAGPEISAPSNHKAPLRLKRKYTHHIPPPSEIRTRGAKVPKYSFERRTHKKILLSSPTFQQAKNKHLRRHHHSPYYRHRSDSGSSAGQTSRPVKEEPNSSLGAQHPDSLQLDQNPLEWSVADVVAFIKSTDCCNLARLFKEQEIDGQALLLLTLPTVQEHLELKLGPAIKLCHHIERVKIAFYENYAK